MSGKIIYFPPIIFRSQDRKVVTSWMMDVCEYFSLHPTTIHGAIAYLDRLQPSDKHSRYEWKMFVVCCILISSKYNESEVDVPDLETLEYLIQLPIPKETLLNYELWTLQKLGWKLNGTFTYWHNVIAHKLICESAPCLV